MFDRLVITQPEGADFKGRTTYFLVSGVTLSFALSAALVISLFAADLSLGTDDIELTELLAPVEMPPTEPKLPEIQPAPQQRPATADTAPKVPTRKVVMARVDEAPSEVPTTISTVQNTQKERPAAGYYDVGKLDSDPVATGTSGRPTDGATTGTTGLGDANTTVAKVVKDTEPPAAGTEEVSYPFYGRYQRKGDEPA